MLRDDEAPSPKVAPVELLSRPIRIAYLVTHPIQYQAPLLRYLSAQPDIDLTVYFQSDLSVKAYYDTEFGRPIQWDVPLLDGYAHEFLPALGSRRSLGRLMPLSYGIVTRLLRGKYDFLWVHGYSRWFNWMAITVAWFASIRVLVRDDATLLSTPRSRLKVWLKRQFFFRVLQSVCDGFLATGTMNRRYFLDNDIDPGRIFLMPNCVDNDYFAERAVAASARREELRAELGLTAGRPIILFAGKFLALKRPGDLLDAFKRLVARADGQPKPYLLFVGDGELRPALEESGRSLGDDVRFLGFRNQSELSSFFDLCDTFVLPSEFESWGMIVNEAMSAGRAVIVSDRVGCAPDLVSDGVNGHVYPCGDVAALAEALANVLRTPEICAAMGRESAEILRTWSFREDIDGLRTALATVLRLRRSAGSGKATFADR